MILPSPRQRIIAFISAFVCWNKMFSGFCSPTRKRGKTTKSAFTGSERAPTSKKDVKNIFLVLTRVSNRQWIRGEFLKTSYLLKFSRYGLTFFVQYLLRLHLHRSCKCSEKWVVKLTSSAVDFMSLLKNYFLTFYNYFP